MITRQELTDLMSFHSDHYLTTTLYLPIDPSPQSSHVIELKELIKQKKHDLEATKLSPARQKSVSADFRKILAFASEKYKKEGARTLVVFSCAGLNFWRVFLLKVSLPAYLAVQDRPHVRGLSMVLDDYDRFLVVLIERSKARLFEAFAGDIAEQSGVLDEVPSKVKKGGFGGYEERKIERHIEDHVRWHYKHVADRAYEFFQKHALNSVILLGTEQNARDFKHYLPHVMQEKVVGSLSANGNSTLKNISQKVTLIEDRLESKREKKLLDRLFDEVNSGGLGVVGLPSILLALQYGQINYLLVEQGFAKNGYRCTGCKSLLTENTICDSCGGKTVAVADVVEELVETALLQGCYVKFISSPDPRISRGGHIGAMLRFRA